MKEPHNIQNMSAPGRHTRTCMRYNQGWGWKEEQGGKSEGGVAGWRSGEGGGGGGRGVGGGVGGGGGEWEEERREWEEGAVGGAEGGGGR